MKKIAILHHNDADGFGAAFAAQESPVLDGSEFLILPVQYGQEPPYAELRAFAPDQIYILDFSYKLPVLTEFMKEFHVVTIDHHKTAAEDLQSFKGVFTHDDGTQDGAIFNMTKSGCVLAWEFFNPEAPVPEILLYVQDRDLWKFDLEHSKEINAYIATLPREFAAWNDFYTPEAYDCGKAILRFQANQIERRVKDVKMLGFVELSEDEKSLHGTSRTHHFFTLYYEDAGGVAIPTVNASDNISEVGEALCFAYPDAPFSMSYCDRPDGKRSYSLRSRNGFDVSVVAKSFGGGGHPGAAGFTLPAPHIFK